jgi:hypothetical protein
MILASSCTIYEVRRTDRLSEIWIEGSNPAMRGVGICARMSEDVGDVRLGLSPFGPT